MEGAPEAKVLHVAGFVPFVPAMNPAKYEILGDDMQILTLKLDDGETCVAEPGAMNFMHPAMHASVNCDDKCGRWCSGESCIMSKFTGAGGDGFVGLTSAIPGKIIPLELSDPAIAGRMHTKHGSFFASLGDAKVSFDIDCNPCTACCGGQGCVRQSLRGTGTAFLTAMGTILSKDLGPGETIVIDTNSLVAWADTTELKINTAGGLCTCCCAGEGMFNTTITGPGRVYMQSMSKEKFQRSLMMAVAGGGGNKEAGGAPVSADRIDR